MKKKGNINLSDEYWNASSEEVAEEIRGFAEEFGSFTPEWFAEVKFHLLKQSGLVKQSRKEFCRLSMSRGLCKYCGFLYAAKKCLLWYGLYKMATWHLVSRAPPCIRLAFAKKSIRTVANFLAKAKLINPPFYNVRSAPSCKALERWGYCNPDEYCKAMRSTNTLEYITVRESMKQSRTGRTSDQ